MSRSPSRAHINWLWEVQFHSMTCQCTKKSNLFAVLGWQISFMNGFASNSWWPFVRALHTHPTSPTLRSLPEPPRATSNLRGSTSPSLAVRAGTSSECRQAWATLGHPPPGDRAESRDPGRWPEEWSSDGLRRSAKISELSRFGKS